MHAQHININKSKIKMNLFLLSEYVGKSTILRDLTLSQLNQDAIFLNLDSGPGWIVQNLKMGGSKTDFLLSFFLVMSFIEHYYQM